MACSDKEPAGVVCYRVFDDHYLAKQLPYLQEKAPVPVASELLEIPSNAPPTLPSPPLLPGEVLRMRQHRVVCVGSYSEPLVGVVYLTNFRVIFHGSPITTPEVLELLKEMHSNGGGGGGITGTLSRGREGDVGVANGSNITNNPAKRTFRRKKFSDPRSSKFYIGGDQENGRDQEEEEEGVASGYSDSLSKVMKKISTLARSTDRHSSNSNKGSPKAVRKTTPHKPIAISLPLSHPNHDDAMVTGSLPNTAHTPPVTPPPVAMTLPRPVPSHNTSEPQPHPLISCKTDDSGFVDPPLSKPASIERDHDTPADSLFQLSNDVDFENPLNMAAVTGSVVHVGVVTRRHVRPLFQRPDSIVAVESDSDSDHATDRYFGSIAEDDLPADLSSPNDDRHGNECYHGDPRYHGNNQSKEPEFFHSRHEEFCPVNKPRPLTLESLQGAESHPLRDSYTGQVTTPPPLDETTPTSKQATSVSKHATSKQATSVSKHATSKQAPPTPKQAPPIKPRKPPRRKNKFQQKNSSDTSCDESPVTSGNQSPLLSPEEVPRPLVKPRPPVKPHVRQQSIRRAPPPPPLTNTIGQSSVTVDTTLNRAQPIAHSSSEGCLLDRGHTLSPDHTHSQEDPRESSSSLYANPPLSAYNLSSRFTLTTPLDKRYSPSWTHTADKRGLSNTWSDPRLNAKMVPYVQYSHSVSISLRTLHLVKPLSSIFLDSVALKLPDGLLLVSKTFSSMKLYLHPMNTFDSVKLKELLENTLAYQKPTYSFFAFKYRSSIKLPNPNFFDSRKLESFYSFDAEFNRLGILNAKVNNYQIWRVTSVPKEHPDLCRSYPWRLVVLLCTPDVDLLRAATVYQEGRFPTACWMHPTTESVLLRAAATGTERGQQGTKLPVDEAILQAIRSCNKDGRLFVFTERSEAIGFQDPTKLTTDAARSYYYPNCNFVYSVNPPTFKSVRHSFNKLQAMVLNNVSDEDFLAAMDSTRWLSRVGELIETSCKVTQALTEEQAHVLVCYENGWDRTTQITSLTQLLCDPYYRTMNGFQVLIQKEWMWFGHPFSARNGHQRTKVKSEGPLFLQWLDCVYQVMRQFPLAFEFNENMLLALVDQSYSDQFGTFLMNSDREREQAFMVPDHYHQSVNANTVSIWCWVAMMNASNKLFFNPLYNAEFHQGVIYPKYYQTCLGLWRNCYERDKIRSELQQNGGYSLLRCELNQLLALYNERIPAVAYNDTNHSSSKSLPKEETTPSTVYGGGARTVSRTKSDKLFSSIAEYLINEGYDPSICHHISLVDKTCQGYLVKEGGVMKNWKKRWFVLDYRNEYFAYFETMEHYIRQENPKGVISLDQIRKVSLSTKREHLVSNLFQLRTPTRLYNVKAPSIITMEMWMACLRLPPSALKW